MSTNQRVRYSPLLEVGEASGVSHGMEQPIEGNLSQYQEDQREYLFGQTGNTDYLKYEQTPDGPTVTNTLMNSGNWGGKRKLSKKRKSLRKNKRRRTNRRKSKARK